MPEEQSQLPSKKEDYDQKREEKERVRSHNTAKRILGYWATLGVGTLLFVGGIVLLWPYVPWPTDVPASEIVARNGIHWHPELSIYIKGQKQEIPANIGLGIVHNPVHTHDTTGVIHLEFIGTVTKDDTRLGRFFDIWGKQFNQNCIFSASGGEFCNGPDGTMKMTVNGSPDTEFENYLMQDKDKIEIRFE